jgi:hypothetical protein
VIEEALIDPAPAMVIERSESQSQVSESSSPTLSNDEEKLIEDKLRGLGSL